MADSKNIWAPTLAPDKGCFYGGPLGTPLPTDALATLNAALLDHGYMGEDGFTNGIKRNVTKHKAFGGETVLVTQDDYEETLQVVFYEITPITMETVFGHDQVEVDWASGHRKMTVRHATTMLPRRAYVVRTIMGVKTRLLVVPEGQVTEIQDITLKHTEPSLYVATIDCFRPASGTNPGNPEGVNEYFDEPDVLDPTS